jgi:hypothetical protein
VSGPMKLPDGWKPDFTTLWNLQVLSTVSLNPRTANYIVRAKLPNVRKLGLWFKPDQSNYDVADVLKSIVNLGKLRILKIINSSDQTLPNSFPSTITKITLEQVCLRASGFMLELGTLPNLQILKLNIACFLLISRSLKVRLPDSKSLSWKICRLQNGNREEAQCQASSI